MEVNLTEIIERLMIDRNEAQLVVDTAQATVHALTMAIETLDTQRQALLTSQGKPVRPVPVDKTKPSRDDARMEKVMALLASGPKSTREMAKALGGDRLVLKSALQRLRKDKLLRTIGEKNGQKWALPAKDG